MNTYLLSIKELQEVSLDGELYMEALKKVDSNRREKIMRLTGESKKKVSLGAGLLLQYAVKMYQQTSKKLTNDVGACGENIECLHVSDIIKEIQHPQDFTYTYGQNGKPYFVNLPVYFNLSHSGDYVLCVVADCEVGADIQQMNDIDYWKTAERFFREKEVAIMRQLATAEEQKRFFYNLWARKEAYGKYTGDGVSKALAVDMIDFPEGTMWKEYENLDGYYIAICQAK